MSDFTLTFGDPLEVSIAVPEGATQVSVSIPEANPVVVNNALAVAGGTGAAGVGVPVGGTTGQSLVKSSGVDYATTWADRLSEVVEDTSPTLGGDLDTDTNAILFKTDGLVDAGSLAYDNDENTLAYTNASGISIELGEKSVFYGKANEAISKGDVVMFAGSTGSNLLFRKADQSISGFKPEWVVGFAAQDMALNDHGYVVWFGKLDGLSGYSEPTFSQGDLLYLHPTNAGEITTTEPAPPAHSILLAAVLTTSPGNAGRIIIRPSHKPDTDEVPEGSTNLYYTAARAQADVPTLKSANFTLDDQARTVDLQSGGRLSFRDSSDNALLYIDEANAYVGVGDVTPTAGLHVAADAIIEDNLTINGSTITVADGSTIGAGNLERFTIGSVSGSASVVMNATTSFDLVSTFSSGLRIEDTTNYVALQAPTLSASHTITLPADGGTSGYVLSTDGSGNTSWVAQSGGATAIDDLSDVDTSTVAPTDGQALIWDNAASQWEPGTVSFTDTNTNIAINDLTLTADRTHEMAGYQLDFQNSSTSVFLLTETGAVTCGDVQADSIVLNAKNILSSAGQFGTGSTILATAYTSSALTGDAGEVHYLGASSPTAALANTTSTATGMLVVVTDAEDQAELLVKGLVRIKSDITSASKGDIVYLDPSTLGGVTTTAPTGSGQVVRILGYVTNPTNRTIYFDPSPDWIELT